MAKILIVDDEINTINVLRLMLEEAGYEILIAANGQQGIDIAREHRPDLIITDVLMPVMDGYVFYKKLKEDPITKNIPVIILTARGAMEAAFEAIGADRFLEKPVEAPDLMVTIVNLLERSDIPSHKKQHQRVLVAGTYHEVVDAIADYAKKLGHDVKKVFTAADVLRESVTFKEDVLILDVQADTGDSAGDSAGDVIRAVRLLPELSRIPILLYSYYRVSDLGDDDFRDRILNIEKAKDDCISAGATEYFDRYNEALFQEWGAKYI